MQENKLTIIYPVLILIFLVKMKQIQIIRFPRRLISACFEDNKNMCLSYNKLEIAFKNSQDKHMLF